MAYFVLGLLTLAISCSNDKSTTPSEPAETLLTSETIGVGGGTIDTDDFALTVPAGAFTGEVELDLYDASDDHVFGDDAISPVFRIKGLPDEFSEPLQTRLKYEGTLSEESYIAQGVEDYFVGEDEPSVIYDFLTATDSNGFLWAEVPARSGKSSSGKLRKAAMEKGSGGLKRDDFVALANHKLWVETSRFKIHYPIYLIDYVDDLKSYLDAAYDEVVALGFGYQGKSWNWPMNISILDYLEKSSDVICGVLVPGSRQVPPSLAFNADNMSMANLYRFKHSAGWGMMVAAQTIYENGRSAYDQPGQNWLHSAVATWGGELIDDAPQNYIPRRLPGRELAVFSGLRAGAGNTKKKSWDHGKGICPVIKFLMEDSRFGADGLLRCYQYIKNGDDATTALIDALYETENEWFPDFFRQYLQGNIYNVAGDVFTKSSNISGTMNTKTDTLKEFPDTYPDLSAKLYRVDLDTANLSDGSSISFEVDASQTHEEYVTVQVYRLKDNTLEFVTQGLNVSVTNVKEAARDGYDLIVCVVNASNEAPYTGSSPLELTVRVIKPPQYTWCRISVGLTVVMLDDDDTTHYEAELLQPRWTATGQMTENSFTWDIDSTYHGNTNTHGTMSVTIDPGSMTVFSFSANATTVDAWGISRWSIAGTALPQEKYIPNNELTCQTNGTATCGRITDFQWSYESYASADSEVTSRRCQASAYVSVSLKR